MTIAREIEKLIERLDGVAVCDGCITDKPNLSVPAQANVVTRALAGQHGRAPESRLRAMRRGEDGDPPPRQIVRP